MATSCQKGWTPCITNPFLKTAGMKVPTTDPTMLPMPPKRLVPPMTAAEMAARLSRVCAHRGGVEPGDVNDPRQPREEAAQGVDLQEVPVHVYAHPAGRLRVRAYGVGVAPELGPVQREDRHDNHHQPYSYRDRQESQELARADLGLYRRRNVGNVGAPREDLRRPEEYPQGSERGDKGRQPELRDE